MGIKTEFWLQEVGDSSQSAFEEAKDPHVWRQRIVSFSGEPPQEFDIAAIKVKGQDSIDYRKEMGFREIKISGLKVLFESGDFDPFSIEVLFVLPEESKKSSEEKI